MKYMDISKLNVEVDYRKLRLNNLCTPQFSHLLMLLFWPVFGVIFAALERFRTTGYHIVYSPVDDLIPFCEFFVIPYFFWFVYLVGMYVYSIFWDIETFKKYTWYIILTYTATVIIYIFWPTAQELRPVVFERNNVFTGIMKRFYNFDTNTNVCPSLHVIGAVAVSAAAWNSKLFSKTGWRIAFTVTTLLIIVSTVFLKQHSVVDIPPALAICVLAYTSGFREKVQCVHQKHVGKTESPPFKKSITLCQGAAIFRSLFGERYAGLCPDPPRKLFEKSFLGAFKNF